MTWYLFFMFEDIPTIVGVFTSKADCMAALQAAIENAGRDLPLKCMM